MQVIQIKRSSAYAAFGLMCSGLYAYFVANFVFFWRYASPSSDIHNYVAGSDRYINYLAYRTNSWIDYISNEISFHYIYMSISQAVNDPIFGLQLISVFSSVLIFYAVFPRRISVLPLFSLILHPRVLDLLASQQRFALAMALFIVIILFMRGSNRGLATIPVATFHTFFIVPAVLTFAFDKLNERFDLKTKYIALAMASVLFVFGQEAALGFIGDRRAETFDGKSFGFYYLLMWILTYSAVIVSNRRVVDNVFGFLFVFTAMLSVLSASLGLYSERYVSASILFLLMFASSKKTINIKFISLVVLLNMLLSYYYWIGNTF
jgi:hypothetical protein